MAGRFGLGLTIFYALLSFLFLYLWSRTDFTRELQGLTEVVETEVGKADSAASKALLVVNRQLGALKGGQPPTQDELKRAVSLRRIRLACRSSARPSMSAV